MSATGPDFRNIEGILAGHAELTGELDRMVDGGEEHVDPTPARIEEFRLSVEDYLQRVARAGVWLHNDTDRVSAVGRLSGWVNELYRLGAYRGGVRPPSVQLAPFAPELQSELSEEDFPYASRGAKNSSAVVDEIWNRHIALCLERLRPPAKPGAAWVRLLVIAGAPGSGRSSLMENALAKVLAQTPLAEGLLPLDPLRSFVPGNTPLVALAQHLLDTGLVTGRDPGVMASDLERDPALLAEWLRNVQPPKALCIDRLEELFTLGAPHKKQEAFMRALLHLAGDPESRHAVVAVFDSEFTGRLPQFEKFFAAAKSAWVSVNLDPNELRQLITEPAKKIGLLFEEGLVEQLVADIQGDPAAITLLQFTLRRLWQRRERNLIPWQAYRELCSGRLALDLAASDTLARFAPESAPDREERVAIVRAIFLALVRPEAGGGVRVRSLAPAALEARVRAVLQRSGSPPEAKADAIHQAVEMFRAEQLLTLHADGEIALAHEAMVTRWQQLVEWIEIDRAEVRHRSVLRVDAEQWDAARQGGKDARGLLYSEQKLAQWSDVREQLRQESEDPDDHGSGRKVIEFLAASEAQCRRARRRFYVRWATVGVVAIVAVYAYQKAQVRARDAQLELRREKAMSLYVNHGSALLAEGDPAGALLWFALARRQEKGPAKGPKAGADPAAEAHRMSLGIALRQLPELSGFTATDGLVGAEISPTGKHALLARRREGEQRGGVDLWSLQKTEAKPIPLVTDRSAACAVFSADGKYAAFALGESGEGKGAIEVWDVEADPPRRVASQELDNVPTFVAFHPKQSNLLAACWGHESSPTSGVWRGEVRGAAVEIKPLSASPAAGSPSSIAFSPAGDRLAVGYTLAGGKGLVRVIESESGAVHETPDTSELLPVTAVTFSNDPEGRYLATATNSRAGDVGDARIYRWDPEPQEPPATRLTRHLSPLQHPEGGGLTGVFFSPKDTRLRLLTIGSGGRARIWEAAGGRLLARLPHDGWVFSAAWSPDGGKVATGSRDRFARIWNANTGDLVLPPLHHGGTLTSVRFTPDGTHLLATTLKGARLWETLPRERSALPVPAADSPTATVVSRSGALLAAAPSAGSKWGHLLLFRLGQQLKPAARLDADQHVKLLAIGEYGLQGGERRDDWVAAITEYSDPSGAQKVLRKLLFWPVKSADEYTWKIPVVPPLSLKTEPTHLGFVGGTQPRAFIVRKPDAAEAGGSGVGSVVEVYDAGSGKLIRGPVLLPFRVSAAAVSVDGSKLAFGGGEKRPRLGFACWLATEGSDPPVFLTTKSPFPDRADAAHDEMVVALAFSPDGRQLASGSEDDSICLWRLNDGARLWRGKHTADISSLSFSEKGTYLLSTSFDSTAVVRATEGGRTITAVQHQGTVRSGAFSPDERFFATAGEDRSVRLWGRDSGDLIAVLPHTCDVLRVIFAEDKASLITFGRRVPSASAAAASRTASAGAMEVRRWSILGGTQSTRAFTQLGEFLGMREFGENQRLTLLNDPAKLDALWANYRKEATTSPAGMESEDFRLTEARQAEAFGDDASAAWHLRQPGPVRKDIDRLMDEARVFAAVGDWRRVIVATEQAKGATDSKDMQQDLLEMHAQAKLELGSAFAENGELEAAKPELEHALDDYRKIAKLDPKGSLWRTQQAQALFLLSRHSEALAALDEAISIKPSPSHYRRKATIYLRLGDAKSYLATSHAALAQFPKGNERASAAWCCLLDVLPGSDASSPELDLAALLPIFEKNPGSYTQRNTLGALFYRLGGTVNTERSIEVLNESIQLFERSPARQNRDAYAVDSSLPGGRPVDWIFLAMAHFRYAADESAAISPTERERHDKLGVRYRNAVDQILRKNGPLSEFSTGPIAWSRLELEVLLAGCDRDYPRR